MRSSGGARPWRRAKWRNGGNSRRRPRDDLKSLDWQTNFKSRAKPRERFPFGPHGRRRRGHSKQLAELTIRKEDLERELARQSEPFRRKANHQRASWFALPAQTVVVDLTEAGSGRPLRP